MIKSIKITLNLIYNRVIVQQEKKKISYKEYDNETHKIKFNQKWYSQVDKLTNFNRYYNQINDFDILIDNFPHVCKSS